MKIIKYPDNSSYVTIPKEWENTTQHITFRINNYEDVVHLVQLCDVLVYNNVLAQITIPCLLDAQADKRFNEFHSSGLKVLSKIITLYDDIYFKIFHPHNPEVTEAFIPNVKIIDNSRFISHVLWSIRKNDKKTYPNILHDKYIGLEGYYRDARIDENLILMSSDAGGFKPLIKLCNESLDWKGQTYSAVKSRNPLNGKLEQYIHRDNFEGKDILIVDDICVYGSTFKGLSTLLKEKNCGKLYLAVSHITVQDLGDDPVTNYFDKVFTTNSKYDKYYHQKSALEYKDMVEPKNLEIIKLF